MNPKVTAKRIERVYKGINSYGVSASERRIRHIYDSGFVYGETPVKTAMKMIDIVKPTRKDVFYDLGSGSGKVVFAFAALSPCKKAVGIEYLKSFVVLCNRLRSKLRIKNAFFRCADISECDFSDATIVFLNATCMSSRFLSRMKKKLVKLKRGSRIIVLSKGIRLPCLEKFDQKELRFSWAYSTVNFYRKI